MCGLFIFAHFIFRQLMWWKKSNRNNKRRSTTPTLSSLIHLTIAEMTWTAIVSTTMVAYTFWAPVSKLEYAKNDGIIPAGSSVFFNMEGRKSMKSRLDWVVVQSTYTADVSATFHIQNTVRRKKKREDLPGRHSHVSLLMSFLSTRPKVPVLLYYTS